MGVLETVGLERYLNDGRIAYFSMEIGLNDEMHTYSGGLGVLAGDFLRAGADLRLPLVAVTLVSRNGYFRRMCLAYGCDSLIFYVLL